MSKTLIQSKLSKILSLAVLCGSTLIAPAYAASEKAQSQNENIEVTQQQVTPEELAAIYVLSDICPTLLDKDAKFDAGLEQLLHDYMPGEKQPLAALKKLSKQSSFKPALKQAQEDAKKAGEKANRDICQDVVNYQAYK
ncbi:hypothetical protein EC844_10719 [Acinetobacter calcoaceticus]|uniref:DUF7944 domain-containing protein n=1 Tax=Acinetobacter calcoaceticus TaxID=471 RepID=A0A4R1XZ55_ACICA|nr:hypothetical protein EC844_10719 [Acinetobacter calcoaceticus]